MVKLFIYENFVLSNRTLVLNEQRLRHNHGGLLHRWYLVDGLELLGELIVLSLEKLIQLLARHRVRLVSRRHRVKNRLHGTRPLQMLHWHLMKLHGRLRHLLYDDILTWCTHGGRLADLIKRSVLSDEILIQLIFVLAVFNQLSFIW